MGLVVNNIRTIGGKSVGVGVVLQIIGIDNTSFGVGDIGYDPLHWPSLMGGHYRVVRRSTGKEL